MAVTLPRWQEGGGVVPHFVSEEEFAEMEKRVRMAAQPGARASLAGERGTFKSVASGPAGKPSSPYKSKWEAAYASKLDMAKRANHVCQYWYEPFSLWLPGKVRYKPDFLVQYGDTIIMEIIEVKGWSKNRRDGMTRLKIAAALFPCFTWKMVYKVKGGGWMEESV